MKGRELRFRPSLAAALIQHLAIACIEVGYDTYGGKGAVLAYDVFLDCISVPGITLISVTFQRVAGRARRLFLTRRRLWTR